MIIDTHSHLHASEFDADRDEVIQRAEEAGVRRIILIGENIADSRRALDMARENFLFRVAAGVHPHKATEWGSDTRDELNDLLAVEQVVAVGEVGLDWYYDFAPRDAQIAAFVAQVRIAAAARKPMVVHCREAYPEMLDILRVELSSAKNACPGVMHCWFGTPEHAHQYLGLGFLIGVGGAVTFKKAEELHQSVREIPIEKIVLETDAPYMAPVPHRGKRNEPSMLPLVVRRIAELKNLSEEEVLRATRENAERLFGI